MNKLSKIGLLVVTLILTLLFVEWCTRFIFNRNGMNYGIEMWKYAKLLKKQSDVKLISHEHYPNREAVLMGVPVKTNSYGLRDYEYSISKSDHTFRILILGDSMTFGWGTSLEDTYPKALERMLNENLSLMNPDSSSNIHRFEVINAGVGNYNTVQEVAYFRERGIKFRPGMVILGFYLNDAEELPRRASGFIKEHSYLYILFTSVWDAFQRTIGWKKGYQNYYLDLYKETSQGWIDCQQALKELMSTCKLENMNLYIAIIPELHHPNHGYAFNEIHSLIAGIGKQHNVPIIDLLPEFYGITPDSLWVSPGDPHPNGRAHAIIAKGIYNQVGRSLKYE